MFENLTEKLDKTFKKLRGHGKLSEKNIQDALKEVRLALLEADVNYKVVKKLSKDYAIARQVHWFDYRNWYPKDKEKEE